MTSNAEMRKTKKTTPGTSMPRDMTIADARKVSNMNGTPAQNSLMWHSGSGTGFASARGNAPSNDLAS